MRITNYILDIAIIFSSTRHIINQGTQFHTLFSSKLSDGMNQEGLLSIVVAYV